MIDNTDSPGFYVEDTYEGCYRDIIAALLRAGWRKVGYQKRGKEKRRKVSTKDTPRLVWTINEKDVDFTDLQVNQLCNHYEGITFLTTKMGFCDLLRESLWVGDDYGDLSPRCYSLGDPVQRIDFIENFKLTAASNLLKLYVIFDVRFDTPPLERVLKLSISAVSIYLKFRLRELVLGENNGPDQVYLGLNETDWNQIMQVNYDLSLQSHTSVRSYVESNLYFRDAADCLNASSCLVRCSLLLKRMRSIDSQFDLSGYKNIWIVKAPEACRGVGMKVLCKLVDILDCEKGMGGRIVQKYIEAPLLSPLGPRISSFSSSLKGRPQNGLSQNGQGNGLVAPANDGLLSKFDIRVWVLVLSFQPLRANIYSHVYGRKCSTAYNCDIKNLGDSLVHLTNYSVQRKQFSGAAGIPVSNASNLPAVPSRQLEHMLPNHPIKVLTEDGAIENFVASDAKIEGSTRGHGDSSLAGNISPRNPVSRLRSTIDEVRAQQQQSPEQSAVEGTQQSGKDKVPAQSSVGEGDLLMFHDDIVQLVCGQSSHKSSTAHNEADSLCKCTWCQAIWPTISRKIVSSLRLAQTAVTSRSQSFELLGYDIMLDSDLQPWIIEVNMSPAMAHRNDKQNEEIKKMAEGLVDLAILQHPINCLHNITNGRLGQGYWQPLSFQDDMAIDVPTGIGDLKGEDASVGPVGKKHKLYNDIKYSFDYVIPNEELDPMLYFDTDDADDFEAFPVLSSQQKLGRGISGVNAIPARPKSAGSVSSRSRGSQGYNLQARPRVSSGGNGSGVGPSAQTLTLVGSTCSKGHMKFIDTCCDVLESTNLLQRWGRRVILRCRLYHQRRKDAAIVIQCNVRVWSAIRLRIRILQHKMAIVLQCCVRQFVAVRRLNFLFRTRNAILIQNRLRILLARRLRLHLKCSRCAGQIMRWYCHRLDIRRRKSAYKIVMSARRWLQRRMVYKVILYKLLRLNLFRRHRQARMIQRMASYWLRRRAIAGKVVSHCLKLVYLRRRRCRKTIRGYVLKWRAYKLVVRAQRQAQMRSIAEAALRVVQARELARLQKLAQLAMEEEENRRTERLNEMRERQFMFLEDFIGCRNNRRRVVGSGESNSRGSSSINFGQQDAGYYQSGKGSEPGVEIKRPLSERMQKMFSDRKHTEELVAGVDNALSNAIIEELQPRKPVATIDDFISKYSDSTLDSKLCARNQTRNRIYNEQPKRAIPLVADIESSTSESLLAPSKCLDRTESKDVLDSQLLPGAAGEFTPSALNAGKDFIVRPVSAGATRKNVHNSVSAVPSSSIRRLASFSYYPVDGVTGTMRGKMLNEEVFEPRIIVSSGPGNSHNFRSRPKSASSVRSQNRLGVQQTRTPLVENMQMTANDEPDNLIPHEVDQLLALCSIPDDQIDGGSSRKPKNESSRRRPRSASATVRRTQKIEADSCGPRLTRFGNAEVLVLEATNSTNENQHNIYDSRMVNPPDPTSLSATAYAYDLSQRRRPTSAGTNYVETDSSKHRPSDFSEDRLYDRSSSFRPEFQNSSGGAIKGQTGFKRDWQAPPVVSEYNPYPPSLIGPFPAAVMDDQPPAMLSTSRGNTNKARNSKHSAPGQQKRSTSAKAPAAKSSLAEPVKLSRHAKPSHTQDQSSKQMHYDDFILGMIAAQGF